MRRQMGPLVQRLEQHVQLVFPDAPLMCSAESVERVYGPSKAPRPREQHRSWWNASDEGRIYAGWPDTVDYLRCLFEEHKPVGIIGFSQGSILSTALCALSQAGEFPTIEFSVLIAGGPPRAEDIVPYLKHPLRTPSLHIWGTEDAIMKQGAPALVEHFSEAQRSVVNWNGEHQVPRRGPAADAIEYFVRNHAS